MSMSFRTVKEVWGAASSQFIEHDDLVQLLQNIGDKFGATDVTEYDEQTVVWIEGGKEFLAFLGSKDFTPENIILDNAEYYLDDLKALMENMRGMRVIWKRELDGGSLRFYVD